MADLSVVRKTCSEKISNYQTKVRPIVGLIVSLFVVFLVNDLKYKVLRRIWDLYYMVISRLKPYLR